MRLSEGLVGFCPESVRIWRRFFSTLSKECVSLWNDTREVVLQHNGLTHLCLVQIKSRSYNKKFKFRQISTPCRYFYLVHNCQQTLNYKLCRSLPNPLETFTSAAKEKILATGRALFTNPWASESSNGWSILSNLSTAKTLVSFTILATLTHVIYVSMHSFTKS